MHVDFGSRITLYFKAADLVLTKMNYIHRT